MLYENLQHRTMKLMQNRLQFAKEIINKDYTKCYEISVGQYTKRKVCECFSFLRNKI